MESILPTYCANCNEEILCFQPNKVVKIRKCLYCLGKVGYCNNECKKYRCKWNQPKDNSMSEKKIEIIYCTECNKPIPCIQSGKIAKSNKCLYCLGASDYCYKKCEEDECQWNEFVKKFPPQHAYKGIHPQKGKKESTRQEIEGELRKSGEWFSTIGSYVIDLSNKTNQGKPFFRHTLRLEDKNKIEAKSKKVIAFFEDLKEILHNGAGFIDLLGKVIMLRPSVINKESARTKYRFYKVLYSVTGVGSLDISKSWLGPTESFVCEEISLMKAMAGMPSGPYKNALEKLEDKKEEKNPYYVEGVEYQGED